MLKLGQRYENPNQIVIFSICTLRYIRGETDKTNRVIRQVGNVTKDSELTFEYGIKLSPTTSEQPQQKEGQRGDVVDPDSSRSSSAAGVESDFDEMPFQVQIVYTDMKGASSVRVLTETKRVTRDRAKAEERKWQNRTTYLKNSQ